MINNQVNLWRKTGQKAWKWSMFLKENPTSSSTGNSADSGWQTGLWLQRHQIPPRVSTNLFQGSSEKCDLQCANVLPESPPHIKRVWCNPPGVVTAALLPFHPRGRKCLSANMSEHLWKLYSKNVTEVWDMRLHAAPWAIRRALSQVQSQPKVTSRQSSVPAKTLGEN